MRYFVFPGLVMLICLSLSGAQSGQQSKKPEPLAILGPQSSFSSKPLTGQTVQALSAIPVSLLRTGRRWPTSRTPCRIGVITY